jgi:PTH1 family peptidyl-tRNA hydrolase
MAESEEGPTLIVGLGNPGRDYAGNRHNIGFRIADRWVVAHELSFNKIMHHAIIANGHACDQRVIVAKPQTYMNDSGRAVGALLKFYKIPLDRLLVIFDDLDLPFGTIRLRAEGGAGGHNGMRSIIQQLGGRQFARLRVGIGRPPGRMDPAVFVLQDFQADEIAELSEITDRALQAIDSFITSGITPTMNQFNTNPPREKHNHERI